MDPNTTNLYQLAEETNLLPKSAVNSLTKYVDYEDKKLFYSYPDKIFKYCVTNLSKYIVLKTNYQTKKNTIPFEYTMAVFKK